MEPDKLELFTSQIYLEETSDDSISNKIKRAILKIPLINLGMNSKSLEWTEETMQKVAHMFRGVPFRYDLNGQNEGSHTKDRLSSPFYDVGWTYQDERGAYYDPIKKSIFVQGEVTNPEVIEKLQRVTSDGRREINFASMGALISPKDTRCSICNKSPFGLCSHSRGENYNGKTCSMIPTNVTKALHVALTNDPADKVAEIADAIFQDMTTNMVDNTAKQSPVSVAPNTPGPDNATQSDLTELITTIVKKILDEKNKQVEVADNSKEDSKMDEDKKKKKKNDDKVEEKVDLKDEKKSTEQIDDSKEGSLKKETASAGEVSTKGNSMKSETGKAKVMTAEEEGEPDQAPTEDDSNKEYNDDDKDEEEDEEEKKKKKKHESKESPKHEKSETKSEEMKEDKKEMADDGIEFSLKGPAGSRSQQNIEVADNTPKKAVIVETASNDMYAQKYKVKLLQELADMYVKFNKAESRDKAILILQDKSIEQLEIYQDAMSGIIMPAQEVKQIAKPVLVVQDNTHSVNKFTNDVPEFGGVGAEVDSIQEVADMSPTDRRKNFGEYGSFDLCFNPQNVQRYRKTNQR